MTTKVVKLGKKYQHNVENILLEQETVQNVLNNTFSKYINEHNHNTMEYAVNTLVENYRYVPNDTILTEGRYVRYLDMKNPFEIHLRLGGFVLHDNGYTVTLKGNERSFRISKRRSFFFSQINDTDRIRAAVHDYIKN